MSRVVGVAVGFVCVFGALAANAHEETSMVSIAGGSFRMGSDTGRASERPAHAVTVASFAMDVTEVTAGAYEACIHAGVCTAAAVVGESCNDAATHPAHPANCVDWNDARTYCQWLGKRLPTEEEWEFGARGTDGRAFPWGNAQPTLSIDTTMPVGSFPESRSPFGIHDMAGNVWEWTESAWSDDYASPREDRMRVVRGGGFGPTSTSLVSATVRGVHRPSFRGAHVGFRCAK